MFNNNFKQNFLSNKINNNTIKLVEKKLKF